MQAHSTLKQFIYGTAKLKLVYGNSNIISNGDIMKHRIILKRKKENFHDSSQQKKVL